LHIRQGRQNRYYLFESLWRLENNGGTKYPDRALAEGVITDVYYFAYMKLLYESVDRLLELENEYQKALETLLYYRM